MTNNLNAEVVTTVMIIMVAMIIVKQAREMNISNT